MTHRLGKIIALASIASLASSLLGAAPVTAAHRIAPMAPKPDASCSEKQSGEIVKTKEMSALGLSLMCVAEESHDHTGALPGKESAKANASKIEYKWVPYSPPISSELIDWAMTGKGDASLAEAAVRVWPEIELGENPPHTYTDQSLAPCKMGNGRQGLGMNTLNLSYGSPGLEGRDAEGFTKSYGTVRIAVNAVYPKNAERNGDTITTDDGQTFSISSVLSNIERQMDTVVIPYFREQSYGKMQVEASVDTVKVYRGAYTRQEWNSSRNKYAWDVQQSWKDIPGSAIPSGQFDMLMSVTIGRGEGANTWDGARASVSSSAAVSPLVGTFSLRNGDRFAGAISIFPQADGLTITHEIGHAMREQDQYETGDSNEIQRRYSGRVGRLSTIRSTGFLGWERYIHRWIDDSRVTCLPIESFAPDGQGVHGETLLPVQRFPYFDEGLHRLIVIPLPDAADPAGWGPKGIVIESWRPWGTDAAFEADPNGGDGLLVYMVDSNGPPTNGARGSWPLANGGVVLYRNDRETLQATQPPGPCARNLANFVYTNDRDAVQLCIRRDAFQTKSSWSDDPQTATYDVTRSSSRCPSGREQGKIEISLAGRTEELVDMGVRGLATREPSDTARVQYTSKCI